MIKGVNKQVLEINEPQNGFFEKAIFFVKPEYSGMSEGKLRESAKEEVENAGKPPEKKSLKTVYGIKKFLIVAVSFGLGLAVGIFAAINF